jgi:DNA-binding PadR family transcriptional regulator
MHGYEMFRQFTSSTIGQIIHLEMSQMYAFLKKLEGLTYVEAELAPQGTRPPRKIFHLTEIGHTIFLAWLTEPVKKPRDIRILFLIKLYFVQRYLPDQQRALIAQQIQACEHFLRHLEAQQQAATNQTVGAPQAHMDDSTFFNHIVLRSRIHQTRSLLDWIRELQREMSV